MSSVAECQVAAVMNGVMLPRASRTGFHLIQELDLNQLARFQLRTRARTARQKGWGTAALHGYPSTVRPLEPAYCRTSESDYRDAVARGLVTTDL